eukprot:2743010-Rhodomonas_salina.1
MEGMGQVRGQGGRGGWVQGWDDWREEGGWVGGLTMGGEWLVRDGCVWGGGCVLGEDGSCLLYTSDAADDM